MSLSPTYAAFLGDRLIAIGAPGQVAGVLRDLRADSPVLIFHTGTGAQLDRGLLDAAIAQAASDASARQDAGPRSRGRPRLGVVSREVTLLPRHWDWLAQQPGGASVVLRRLVEQASRDPAGRARAGADAAYRFLQAIAGDRPGYEEALRALYAGDRELFAARVADWPPDVADFARQLAFPEDAG